MWYLELSSAAQAEQRELGREFGQPLTLAHFNLYPFPNGI